MIPVRPFIRWAGSKRLLLAELERLMPKSFGTYFEPFLGGGSLYLRLQPEKACLGDSLGPLVSTWQTVMSDPDSLIERFNSLPFNKNTYDEYRRRVFTDPLSIATQFLYLNKGAYGGLWRVNREGRFNVPWSNPKTAAPLDESNIRQVAELMRRSDVTVECADFAAVTAKAQFGDLIFFDPPYSVGRPERPFIHYSEALFDWNHQVRLSIEAGRLRDLGAFVIVANSSHPDIEPLYPGFRIVDIHRQNSLSSSSVKTRVRTDRLFISY